MAQKRKLPFYGHSASKLDITERCGYSGTLKTASGRAAVMSQWAHAMSEGNADKAAALFKELDQSEQQEVLSWRLLKEFEYGDMVFSLSAAQKEVRWALDGAGCPVDYESADRVTRGIADLAWVLEKENLLVIGDNKLSSFTSSVDSLQLHSAGIALCQSLGVSRYLPCIWSLSDGEMDIGRIVDLDSREVIQLWDRIQFAATNREGPKTGPHCSKCYGYWQCEAYLTPAAYPDSWLAPVTGGEITLDDQTATSLLLQVEQIEKAAKMVKQHVKTYIEQGGTVELDGERYAKIAKPGRKKLDTHRVMADLGVESLDAYETRGASYDEWRWLKVKK